MITMDEAQCIALGWIDEYSHDPHLAKVDRDRAFFHNLDDLIYHHPNDALLVFEKIAANDLTDWTFEGFAGGPVREFLHLHGSKFDGELDAVSVRVNSFADLIELAREGL